MNGRISRERRLPRALTIAALAALTLLMMLNLGACGKKQQEAEIKTAPEQPAMETPVEVPTQTIPVAEPEPEPKEMKTPALELKPAFFDFDKSDLTPAAREVLNANGRMLKDHPDVRIIIEGHCDERGTVQYNLALGEKRAQAARDYLKDLGIASARMEVVSYGKERPFAMGHNEAAWAQNRRAQFVPRPAAK
jgi:peptidoglycan-associated lipoprotein